MKILVAVKRVVDPYVKIRVDGDKVDTRNVKMAMNPFDEIALEQAVQLKESGKAAEIIAVSIGVSAAQETLRHALALGADRAILLTSDAPYCSLNIAKIIKKIVDEENPELIILGKQSIDGDNNQTAQMLAGLLQWPQATFVSQLDVAMDKLKVTREIDGGLETLSMPLPAVVSVDLRLNQPRYATLPNIMKAKQKPLRINSVESLGLNLHEHLKIVEVKSPETRGAGVKLESVTQLLDKLRHEAKVL